MSEQERPGSPSCEIRLATIDDIAQLSEVESAAAQLFKAVGKSEIAAGETFDRVDLEAGVAAKQLWVAQASSGEIAGFALVICLDAGPHLEEVSVHPLHGRQGIGAHLVEFVASDLEQRGHPRLSLSTFLHVPWNAPFYRKIGFRELPEAEYSPEIVALRHREAAEGFALEERIIMFRSLEQVDK